MKRGRGHSNISIGGVQFRVLQGGGKDKSKPLGKIRRPRLKSDLP